MEPSWRGLKDGCSFSLPCENIMRRQLSANQGGCSCHTPSLPMPWPWDSQPLELWELIVCCLSHQNHGTCAIETWAKTEILSKIYTDLISKVDSEAPTLFLFFCAQFPTKIFFYKSSSELSPFNTHFVYIEGSVYSFLIIRYVLRESGIHIREK